MARCPTCGDIIPSGCNCIVESTTYIGYTGDGNDGSPVLLQPTLSADVDQLAVCDNDDGFGAFKPTLLVNRPTTRVRRDNDQQIPNNTLTALTFDIEMYDTDTLHSLVTNINRVTFVTAGTYLVAFQGLWDPNDAGDRLVEIRKNGTDIIGMHITRAGTDNLYVGQSLAVQEDFAVSDYVEVLVQQTSGADLDFLTEAPMLAVHRLSV